MTEETLEYMMNPDLYAALPPEKKEQYLKMLNISIDYNDCDHPHPPKDLPPGCEGGRYLEQFYEHPFYESDSLVGGMWVGRRMYPPNI